MRHPLLTSVHCPCLSVTGKKHVITLYQGFIFVFVFYSTKLAACLNEYHHFEPANLKPPKYWVHYITLNIDRTELYRTVKVERGSGGGVGRLAIEWAGVGVEGVPGPFEAGV